MKIAKHCSSAFPSVATGAIVGMENEGLLEVTNTFPFPTVDPATTDSHQNDASQIAAAAPRQKNNIHYQNEMIRHLKEVNVDAINLNFIENQFHYQSANENTVALVHDASKSSQGNLTFRAFRLSPAFMSAYKEGKFTTERYDDVIATTGDRDTDQ
jgi:translation initiation factor 3 subunit H